MEPRWECDSVTKGQRMTIKNEVVNGRRVKARGSQWEWWRKGKGRGLPIGILKELPWNAALPTTHLPF
jgi:hypothetical protein